MNNRFDLSAVAAHAFEQAIHKRTEQKHQRTALKAGFTNVSCFLLTVRAEQR